MSIINYTGKMNSHEEYINVLNKIEQKCKYIEIVTVFGNEDNEIVNKFNDDVISVKKVSSWWGTETRTKNNLYRIKATPELFAFISKYETFCKYYEYGTTKKSFSVGDYSEETDFGCDDIAFYDEKGQYLLHTTTHEGYISISDELV